MNEALVVFVLALLAPLPPAPPAAHLKTIVTVKSTPYCSALGTHYNRIVPPLLGNDRTLDGVGTTLDDVTAVFTSPSIDYESRFLNDRTKMMDYVATLRKSLPGMQSEINQLRAAATLSRDPASVQEMHQLTQELQRAYDHQRQLAIDLGGVVQTMVEFDIFHADPMGMQQTMENLGKPKDEKDIKSYLRFDGQRATIADAENRAGDLALNIAEKRCTLQ